MIPAFDGFERIEGAAFFVEDDVGGFGPDEGLGVGVVRTEVVLDGGLQVGDAGEGAAPDALPRDLGEEALDQIEPGALVGVKCRWKRGCLASQAFTAGVLCVP